MRAKVSKSFAIFSLTSSLSEFYEIIFLIELQLSEIEKYLYSNKILFSIKINSYLFFL